MILRAIEERDIPLVHSWLRDPANRQWLDLESWGLVSPDQLRNWNRSDRHYLRLFSSTGDSEPLGLVALSDIHAAFGTAMPWYVLGSKSHIGKFHTASAVASLIAVAFEEMELRSLHTWTVETNIPAIRLLRHSGFRFIGRQRHCHIVNGQLMDRLWFDLLKSEYREQTMSFAKDTGASGPASVLEFPRVWMDSPAS
jgi:RimJ/RimL family protein N-acetyltransferase